MCPSLTPTVFFNCLTTLLISSLPSVFVVVFYHIEILARCYRLLLFVHIHITNFNLGITRSVSTRLYSSTIQITNGLFSTPFSHCIHHLFFATHIGITRIPSWMQCLEIFSLGIVLHLLFRVKQHHKSCMSENAVLMVSLLDLYHFKDFHRIQVILLWDFSPQHSI